MRLGSETLSPHGSVGASRCFRDGNVRPVGLTSDPWCSSRTHGDLFMSADGRTAAAVEHKNGRRTAEAAAEAEGGGGKFSMLTWFVVLALLGVWSSVAVVYFDVVDYDSVIGKNRENNQTFWSWEKLSAPLILSEVPPTG